MTPRTKPAGHEEDLEGFYVNAPQHFAELQQVYRTHGFEAGYRRAIRDQLASLVLQAEEFLKSQPPDPRNRKLVYQFVAHLQLEVSRLAPREKIDCRWA